MKEIFKKIWPEAAAVLFFIILSFSYFASPVSEGLVLTGQDNTAAVERCPAGPTLSLAVCRPIR